MKLPGNTEAENDRVLLEESAPFSQAKDSSDQIEHLAARGWKKSTELLSDDLELPLTFYLKHTSHKKLKDVLMQISDPDNEKYQQYLTKDEIAALIEVPDERINKVEKLLTKAGLSKVTRGSHRDVIHAIASVKIAQELFQVDLVRFVHEKDPSSLSFVRAAGEYTLPKSLAKEITLVGGIARLPLVKNTILASSDSSSAGTTDRQYNVSPSSNSVILEEEKSGDSDHADAGKDFQFTCSKCPVLPSTTKMLRDQYKVPSVEEFLKLYGAPHPQSSQAVAQFFGNGFLPSDIKKYFEVNHELPPSSPSIVGDVAKKIDAEPTLDVETILSVAPQIKTSVWQYNGLRDNTQEKSFTNQEPFLRYMEAVNAADSPPLVHSISYADDENYISAEYIKVVNTELLKAVLRGITVVAAAGDDGVCGYISSQYGACNPKTFQPEFPATSPYVTSVGALTPGVQPGEEIACSISANPAIKITTSGGFSSVFHRPWYQDEAVGHWIENGSKHPPSHLFNKSGRGYPDVSARGTAFAIVLHGKTAHVDGTSASAPLVAGILSLLNDISLKETGKPLGLVNPLLYKAAKEKQSVFTDIRTGSIRCGRFLSACHKYGFEAEEGWDPASGLGSLRFDELVKYFKRKTTRKILSPASLELAERQVVIQSEHELGQEQPAPLSFASISAGMLLISCSVFLVLLFGAAFARRKLRKVETSFQSSQKQPFLTDDEEEERFEEESSFL